MVGMGVAENGLLASLACRMDCLLASAWEADRAVSLGRSEGGHGAGGKHPQGLTSGRDLDPRPLHRLQ